MAKAVGKREVEVEIRGRSYRVKGYYTPKGYYPEPDDGAEFDLFQITCLDEKGDMEDFPSDAELVEAVLAVLGDND